MSHIFVRHAKEQDSEQILNLGRSFFNESSFSQFTWDSVRNMAIVKEMTDGESLKCLVIGDRDREQIFGFTAWSYERYFTTESIAHLFLFYIHPDHRNEENAKALAECMDSMIKWDGAVRAYASSTGGFEDKGVNEAAFTKLLTGFGFTTIGSFMAKEYDHG